jgi:hypothetical protein
MAAEQGVRELSRAEGRAMLGERTQRDLGMKLEAFERAYEAGQLDASNPKVAGLVMLLPFAQ